MPDNSERDFLTNRICQISESHCGPAVIQILLAHLGVQVTQEQVAEVGGARDTIAESGMSVTQLAAAVRQLQPEVQFWYKLNSNLQDVITLVDQHRYPVGVEWQWLFEASEADEDDDGDYGHYSIILHVDTEQKLLAIMDPYKEFYTQNRVFSFEMFDRRWWDYNPVVNPKTGRTRYVKDVRMMFIITPQDAAFPAALGMQRA